MAGAAPPSGQADNSLAPIWITLFIFAVLVVIWFVFQSYIIKGVFVVKLFEISIIEHFTPSLNNLKNYMLHANTEQVTVDILIEICSKVGDYVRYPFMILLGVMGIILIFRSASFRHHRTYNMKSLAQSGVRNWPQISPVLKLDLVKKKLDDGPWAMSPSPMAFAKKHKLLIEDRKPLAEGMLSRTSHVTVSLNRGAAHRVLALQLGRTWAGIDKLTPPQKALFAVFAAKGQGDDAGARKLLSQISASTTHGKLNYDGTNELIKKYANHPVVQEIVNSHAYVLTALATMLELARTDGVLASADFLWLKPLDRPLWYMLNTVGRKTVVCEIAGAFCHWQAEKDLFKRLKVPMVDEAVEALEIAVKEIIYVPDEEKKK